MPYNKRNLVEGTVFYRFDLEETIRELEQLEGNLILIQRLRDVGWDALDDPERAYACGMITRDDELIICESDFEPIIIDGQQVEPEEALESFTISELEDAGLVKDATAAQINKYITVYEMSTNFDLDRVALELLQDDYTFQEIVSAAEDADLIE